jgi:hypothetical protein
MAVIGRDQIGRHAAVYDAIAIAPQLRMIKSAAGRKPSFAENGPRVLFLIRRLWA